MVVQVKILYNQCCWTSNFRHYDGGANTDTLQLSSGTFNFSNNSSIINIETIKTDSSGSTLNLTGQTEGFTVIGNSGADIITGGSGNDTFTGGTGIDTFNITLGTDTVTDLATLDIFNVSSGAN